MSVNQTKYELPGKHGLDMTIQQCAAENFDDIFNATKIFNREIETVA